MLWKKVEQSSRISTKLKEQSGQALIEFVFGLMILMSFFMFYIKLAAVFAIGNYIHYATFMSARTYMASDSTEDQQKSNAEEVLRKMVAKRWSGLIKPNASVGGTVPGGYVGEGLSSQDSPSEDFWNFGTSYSFSAQLGIYPWSKDGKGIDLKLVSESWMPREQSVAECNQTREKVEAKLKQGSQSAGVSVEWDKDNGC